VLFSRFDQILGRIVVLKRTFKKEILKYIIFLVIIFGEFSCAQRLCSKMEIGWSFWPLIVSQLVR
jgi:hypothetical protein